MIIIFVSRVYKFVCTCVQVHAYMCMEARGQPQVLFLRCHLPCFYVTSLTGLELADLNGLTELGSPGSTHCWGHNTCSCTGMDSGDRTQIVMQPLYPLNHLPSPRIFQIATGYLYVYCLLRTV